MHLRKRTNMDKTNARHHGDSRTAKHCTLNITSVQSHVREKDSHVHCLTITHALEQHALSVSPLLADLFFLYLSLRWPNAN